MATQARCVWKRKRNNIITHYTLQDMQGLSAEFTAEQLKTAIRNKEIAVVNLKLTSDNRLIEDKKSDKAWKKEQESLVFIDRKIIELVNKSKSLAFQSNVNIESVRLKAQALGIIFEQLAKDIYKIEKEDSIIVVSNKQLCLPAYCGKLFNFALFSSILFKNIKSSYVENMFSMFSESLATKIDFSNFDTSNVYDMSYMFFKSRAKELDLSSFNTSKVTDMRSMFSDCKANKIDIHNFNTSHIENMEAMFSGISIKELDLSSLDTSKVKNMNGMFSYCKCQLLNLSSFDTSRVKSMDSMFYECEIKELDLSSFNTSSVLDMERMFCCSNIDKLDISSFDISKVKNIKNMFSNTIAKEIVTSKQFERQIKKYSRFRDIKANIIIR